LSTFSAKISGSDKQLESHEQCRASAVVRLFAVGRFRGPHLRIIRCVLGRGPIALGLTCDDFIIAQQVTNF
jgi:hypothetical protein